MTRLLIAPLALSFLTMSAASADGPLEVALWPTSEPLDAKSIGTYEDRPHAGRKNRWLTGVTAPVLSVYRPEASRATGAAVVIFPGGGYGGQAIDKEGNYVAKWLAERGVTGVVVPYRCGGGEHRHPVPNQDAQRAMQTVRRNAEAWGIDPHQVGVMGFSAGGHLAAMTAVTGSDGDPVAGDAIDRVSSRPDFAILVYPVISMRKGVTHGGSRTNLLGSNPSEELVAETSADERITADTPPTLLIHSIDDGAVPVANPQRFYDACRSKGVPVEMHLYETGGHGYGMWVEKGSVAGWPAVLEAWLLGRGLAAAE